VGRCAHPQRLTVAPARGSDDPALDLTNLRHVRALFFDAWGRSPDADELDLARGATPDSLLRHLCGPRDFWEHWYEDELYYFLLIDNARPAEASGDDGLPARLQRGELGVLAAVQAIVSGSAFHRANPGNDTFVSVVLEQLLGVNVQQDTALLQAGKRMYDGQPSSLFGERGASQADVVAIACRQPAFAKHFTERQYRRLVGVEPAPRAGEAWAASLAAQPGGFPELVRGWLSSPAYARRLDTLRAKTDLQFIRGLYVDLRGTPPAPAELQRLRGALSVLADTGPLRSVIARTLLDGADLDLPRRGEVDPEAFVTSSFQRFLGRSPSEQELQDFVVVYAQENCLPATLVAAIVTHPEYQYY